jgi:hypothetical protein
MKIEYLTEVEREQVVGVLWAAFHDYPFGYEVIGEADVAEVHTTYMLLRTSEDPE